MDRFSKSINVYFEQMNTYEFIKNLTDLYADNDRFILFMIEQGIKIKALKFNRIIIQIQLLIVVKKLKEITTKLQAQKCYIASRQTIAPLLLNHAQFWLYNHINIVFYTIHLSINCSAQYFRLLPQFLHFFSLK